MITITVFLDICPKGAEFNEIHKISGNSSKFGEIRGILRNFCFFAKKRDSGENDQKYLKFCFIIATFWSVGGKRCPFSEKFQFSQGFAKHHDFFYEF